MTRPRTILPRTPIYLGCEGESEVAYGVLLNRLVNHLPGMRLHIHAEVLQPGAGDPHELVRRASQRIAVLERHHARFLHKAILLDRGSLQKTREAQALARRSGIGYLIWQDPDHEAFLLRHFEGYQHNRPPMDASLAAIREVWPDYQKGRTRIQLAERIDIHRILQARSVEPDLDAFLTILGVPK